MSPQIKDHEGNDVVHGRALVNGVRLHYMTAGSGAPVLLLHDARREDLPNAYLDFFREGASA